MGRKEEEQKDRAKQCRWQERDGDQQEGSSGNSEGSEGDRRTKYKDIYLGNARVTACTVAGETLRFIWVWSLLTENKKNAIVKP